MLEVLVMDKISVIVPIYNVDVYLDKCIESIVNQTYKNLEIILVNDGSPDNSDIICKKWKNKDESIIYIKQKNSGVSVARNNGIKKSTGQYISFVDGDDYLELNMIEKLHNYISKCKVNIAICDYYETNNLNDIETHFFDKTKKIDINKNKKMILEEIIKFLGVPWGKLYKRDFLVRNKLLFKVGLKRMQDTIFNLEAFELCDEVAYLHESLYYYRIFEESACNKYSPDFDKTAKDILKYFKEYLVKNKLFEKYQDLYYTKMYYLVDEMIKLKYVHDKCNDSLLKIINGIKFDVQTFNLNFDLLSKQFFNYCGKIKFFLLKHHFYLLLYLLYKIKIQNKKLKYYKRDD